MKLAPGTITTGGDALIVGCGDGALELVSVQAEGGRRMSASDYLRGSKPERFE